MLERRKRLVCFIVYFHQIIKIREVPAQRNSNPSELLVACRRYCEAISCRPGSAQRLKVRLVVWRFIRYVRRALALGSVPVHNARLRE